MSTLSRSDASGFGRYTPEVRDPIERTSTSGKESRIPSLDGLRAASILAVLIGHVNGTVNAPRALAVALGFTRVDLGNLGVRVFFVISGLLITQLLVRERERAGRISLRAFYWRRTVRIAPAMASFLAAVVVARSLGWVVLNPGDVTYALTYTMNYDTRRAWPLAHLWSLGVEEQFYVLWPTVLALAGPRRAGRFAVAVVALAPLVRFGEFYGPFGLQAIVGTSFETNADALAVGCLVALYGDAAWARPRIRAAVLSRWVAPLLAAVGLALLTLWRPGILLGATLLNTAIGILVLRVVRAPRTRLGRILNWPAAAFVGTISYSLYLWQQPFLNRGVQAAPQAFPLNVFLAVGAALLSYYCVERPALRARPRIERWWVERRTRGGAPKLAGSDHRVADHAAPDRPSPHQDSHAAVRA